MKLLSVTSVFYVLSDFLFPVLGGSVCSDCVSFGSEWPPPCFEKDLALFGNNLKTVVAETAENCQVGLTMKI